MRQSPDFVSGARSLAGGHEPRVLNMGASGARDGGCDERRAASMAGSIGAEYMHGEWSNTGGVAGMREAGATAASDEPVQSQASKKRPRTEIVGISRDRRWKGDGPTKSCHGCYNSRGKVKVVDEGLCKGLLEVDGAQRACHRWVCRNCLKRWRDAGNESEVFICCLHGTMGSCIFRR